jgi:hypothetical protein
MDASAHAGHRNGHALFPSPEPRPPVRAAPASMGSAGISAGAQVEFKTVVRAPRPRAAAVLKDDDQAVGLANGLGYLSLALGAAELVAPRTIAGSLGMPEAAPVIRGYGAREIGAGIGMLSSTSPRAKARWVWGRVLGDVVDLVTLGAGLGSENPKRGNVAGAMAVVGVVTVLDVMCALRLGKAASPDAARPRAGDDQRA